MLNLDKLCRLCLHKSEKNLLLQDENFYSKVTHLLRIDDLNDPLLPKRICYDCEVKVNQFFDFVEVVKASQTQIYQILSSEDGVKSEVIENDSFKSKKEGSNDQKEEFSEADHDHLDDLDQKLSVLVTVEENVEPKKRSSRRSKAKVQKIKKSSRLKSKKDQKQPNAQKQQKNAQEQNNNAQEQSENLRIREFYDLTCQQCNVTFEKFSAWKIHARSKHGDPNPGLYCCSKKLYRRHHLLTHLTLHVNPDELR